MKPLQPDRHTLRAALSAAHPDSSRVVSDGITSFRLSGILTEHPEAFWRGRSVIIAVETQVEAARAMLMLDGVVRRMVLLPPDVKRDHLAAIVRDAGADTLLCSRAMDDVDLGIVTRTGIGPGEPGSPLETEWLLLTSGTTGDPKIAIHGFAALTGAIAQPAAAQPATWATFYDIRRYGGLQIFLRAVLAGASLVLSRPGEAVPDHLRRLSQAGVTHISGTPSHWRRALMSGAAALFSPAYIRLSGEIADQAVLDALKAAFPAASIGHAYASTEAGVGFDVNDGLEGFPANYLDAPRNGVEMKCVDGTLRIRSPRASRGYAGRADLVMADADGFVDTGDMIEQREGRFYFAGRRGGIINVGGLKVHPEEIEAVLNRHPAVQQSRVRARKSPVIGAIVVADLVVKSGTGATDEVKQQIMDHARASLAAHKVPAVLSIVPTIEMTAGGKVARHA